MQNYGLSKYQIKKAHEKLEFNKEFMRHNGVHIDNKIIPFADFVSNSYFNSNRYVAELQHRAWSIYEYAQERDLKNIFLTLTLPSVWHKKKTFKNRLINNPKFGGRKYITMINKVKFINAHVKQHIPFIEPILDFSQTIDKYTPRNASKELSKMLKKFFDDRSYKNIEKDDRCYFRVTEPHKDGTPHIHMSLFVPDNKVDVVVKSLNRLFPAPLSKIETQVNSPVSYLMKYVLKTLDDLRDDDSKITNLTLWYLYHGISRFYTSRTFVSLEAYRKLNGMYTLRDLTKDYLSEDLSIYIDTTTKKVVKIENEHGIIYTPKPVNWHERLIDVDYTYLEAEYEPLLVPKEYKPLRTYYEKDGETYIILDGIITEIKKQPHEMSYFELHNYFHNLDIETVNLGHYGVTKNLMIDRGLIDGEKLTLDKYTDMGEWLKPLKLEEAEEVF